MQKLYFRLNIKVMSLYILLALFHETMSVM